MNTRRCTYIAMWSIGYFTVAIRYILLFMNIFDETPVLDKVLFLIAILSLIVALCLREYTIKQLVIYVGIIFIGFISYILSGESIAFIAMLLVVSAVDINDKNLVFIHMCTYIPILVFLGIITMLGYGVGVIEPYYFIGDDKYIFNFFLNAKTTYSDMLLSMCLAIICWKYPKDNVKIGTVCIVIVYSLIVYITQSAKMNSAIGFIILALFIFNKIPYINKLFNYVLQWGMAIISLLVLGITLVINIPAVDGLTYKMGVTLYGRFWSGHEAIKQFGITLLGNKIDYGDVKPFDTLFGTINSITLDSFYMKCVVCHGLVLLMVINVLYWLAVKKYNKEGKMYYSISLFILAVCLITDGVNMFPTIGLGVILLKKALMSKNSYDMRG